MEIRPATADHLPAVKDVYDHYVRESVATFDVEPPPIGYWRAKLESGERGDHLLVAVEEGTVLGYAYSSAYRPRPAYGRTREVSVYLAPGTTGRGVGRALYADLLPRLQQDGVHTVLAVVAEPNPASAALHGAFGFAQVGLLPQVGHKQGRWVDTGLWALVLDEPGSDLPDR